jgi:hypothetical protein
VTVLKKFVHLEEHRPGGVVRVEPADQPVAEDGAEQQGEGEPVVAEATSES